MRGFEDRGQGVGKSGFALLDGVHEGLSSSGGGIVVPRPAARTVLVRACAAASVSGKGEDDVVGEAHVVFGVFGGSAQGDEGCTASCSSMVATSLGLDADDMEVLSVARRVTTGLRP
jgi:hypothetical protein